MKRLGALSVVVFLLLLPGTAGAQEWRLDVQGGRLSYDTGPEAASTSVAAGVRYLDRAGQVALTAGVPLSEGEPLWGALDGRRRWATGGALALGLDGAASAFLFRFDQTLDAPLPSLPPETEHRSGWGATLEAMPLLALDAGPFTMEARSGAVWYRSTVAGDAFERAVWLSDGSLRLEPTTGMSAAVDAAVVVADEDSYPFVGANASYALPALSVWGSVGRWLHDAIPTFQWSAGVAVPVTSGASIVVSGAREAFDPVFATPARTVWGAGVSVRLGGGDRTVVEPVPVMQDGAALIRLDADDVSGAPRIAGDFTDWEPQAMERDGDDWIFRTVLSSGVYNYAFVDAAGEWFVPEGTPGRRDDGMGGHVAVLVVP